MGLSLVPCSHYWLAVHYGQSVTAICKHCKKKGVFVQHEWNIMKQYNMALDKPVRL